MWLPARPLKDLSSIGLRLGALTKTGSGAGNFLPSYIPQIQLILVLTDGSLTDRSARHNRSIQDAAIDLFFPRFLGKRQDPLS